MLATTGTLVFLLAASSLAALAIHETLGSGSRKQRAATRHRESRLRDLEARMNSVESRCESLATDGSGAEQMARIQESLHQQDLRLCTLDESLADAMGAFQTLSQERQSFSEQERCDLKRIKGIGAALEQTLNSHGIHNLDQVATLTIDQIEALSEHLGTFASRIERDHWVEQAQALIGADASAG